MATRRRRTPAEIAASVAAAQKTMANRKQNESKDYVKRGRYYIFGVAALFLLAAGLLYAETRVTEVFYIIGPFVVLYLTLGIVYYKNPYVISIIALGIFLFLILLNAIMDPITIIQGLLVKIFIIYALVKAIQSGKNYNAARQRENSESSEILDSEFIK